MDKKILLRRSANAFSRNSLYRLQGIGSVEETCGVRKQYDNCDPNTDRQKTYKMQSMVLA
jgi:hypothetical protein